MHSILSQTDITPHVACVLKHGGFVGLFWSNGHFGEGEALFALRPLDCHSNQCPLLHNCLNN